MTQTKTPHDETGFPTPVASDARRYAIANYAEGDNGHPVDAMLHSICCELMIAWREIAELRASLAKEIRTESLVVVHPDDGRELIYTDRLADSIALRLNWLTDPADEQYAQVVMTAGVESGGDASVYLTACEEMSAMMSTSITSDDGHLSARGSIDLDDASWRRKEDGTATELVHGSRQLRLDASHGVTLHSDYSQIGTVRIEMQMEDRS